MTEYKLQFKSKISRRAAKEMILLLAKHGNHYQNVRFRSDADVKRFLVVRGVDFERLVEQCRDYTRTVPFFENLFGPTFTVSAGLTASRVDAKGKQDLEVQGPGKFTLSGYWATFEAAVKARDRAISEMSYTEFQSAAVQGVASIEGYINYRAEWWNEKHPDEQLTDSPQNKVSLDDKINDWIPKMTNGKKLDKSRTNWQHFQILRSIRDDLAIHPKETGYSISLLDLADKINLLRTGIAGLLVQLHLLFHEKIPAAIIRAAYAPDVETVKRETN